MDKEQQQVREFHDKFGLTINSKPTWPSFEDTRLRENLIDEEFTEYIEAVEANDIIAVADALADMIYVIKGAAVTFGIDLEPILNDVHRSNMSKVWPDGTVHKNAAGKVIKPDTYSPACVGEEIKRQMEW